jgi:hypothetical protein
MKWDRNDDSGLSVTKEAQICLRDVTGYYVFCGGPAVLRIKVTNWPSWEGCPNVTCYWLQADTQCKYTNCTADVAKEVLMCVGQQY